MNKYNKQAVARIKSLDFRMSDSRIRHYFNRIQ